MRATTLLNRLLDLPGISVTAASWHGRQLVVDVRLRATRLACPLCGYTTGATYDSRVVPSWWRSMDYGPHEVIVRTLLRRLECPEHGVRVQGVPFARHRAQFTRDFEDVTACRGPGPRPVGRPGEHRGGRGLVEETPSLHHFDHRS